jgi:hypothetical protein
MGTRALIGYLDTDGDLKLTSTYNHYDGYPQNLGVGLENFYNSDAKAEEIANIGYISYLNSETGEIESVNRQSPKVTKLPDNFNDAMMKIAEQIDSVGGDYGYIWDNENEEWITVDNEGIRSMTQDLEMALAHLKGKFEMMPERPDQTMEEAMVTPDNRVEYLANALNHVWNMGTGRNKIDLHSMAQSLIDDMFDSKETTPEIPGFEGTRDALDALEEGFVRKMKHRAGLIK